MPRIDTTKQTVVYHEPPWTFEAQWFEPPQHTKPNLWWQGEQIESLPRWLVQLTITKHDETWQKVTVVPPFGKSEAQALIGVLQSAVAALRDLEER